MSDENEIELADGMGAAAERAAATPVYDQAFFLALARPRNGTAEAQGEARDRWNSWRRDPASKGVRVTFAGVDFRTKENRGIKFAGFEFGDEARFDGARFGDAARFGGAMFGDKVRFDGAKFGDRARFGGATFGNGVTFVGATFGRGARFDAAMFGGWTRFVGAMFGRGARFVGATFGSWTRFDDATFGNGALFDGRAGDGDIEALRKRWATLEESERAAEEADYRRRREGDGFGPGRFSDLSFASAQFRGAVSFARRSLERPADFTGVRFEAPPDFDGVTNLQRIDFTGARAGFASADRPWWKPDWTTDSTVAIRLRALRSHIEATKNHDFERDLYIEERKAERGIHLKRLWEALRVRRALRIARARLRSLPRLPRIDLFAAKGAPVVAWPERRPSRRDAARPALIDAAGPAAARLGRAYRRNALRFLAALGPLLGHCVWIAVMAVYWALSDYGRSWLRPALWLGVVVLLFHGVGPVDGITAHALAGKRAAIVGEAKTDGRGAEVAARYDEAVGLYAVANSIPFVGPLTIDGEVKRFLFCGEPPRPPQAGAEAKAAPTSSPCIPLPPASLQIATISQNLLSILLVFFIGLALRNYFRLN